MEVSCIVLAGGKSVRLGHDKILEKIGSTSLLEQVISQVDPLSREIIIVTAKERSFTQLADHSKIKTVYDVFPGQGSLGGIYTGLLKSNSQYNLVVAADMPFLNRKLLGYMIEMSQGFDFILPKVNKWFEPLHAIYSRDCLKSIEHILNKGNKVIVELFDYVKVRYIEAEEIDRFDPQHLSFFNINTPEDLERAKRIAEGAAG